MVSNEKEEKSGKLLLGIGAGAIIGGAIMLMKADNRNKAKQGVSGMKDTVAGFANDVKNNPSGTKDQFLDRVKEASSTLKEAVNNVQQIYDTFNSDIKDQLMQVKEDSEDIVSQAKDAGEQLKETGEKVVEAKEELTGEEDSSNDNNNSQSGSSDSTNNRLQ